MPMAEMDRDLAAISVLLIDPFPGTRKGTRVALWNAGLRDIREIDGMDRAALAEGGRSPDLVILDASQDPQGAIALVRDIRRRRTEVDPFAGILAAVFEPVRDTVIGAVRAGADGILLKPASVEAVWGRVNGLMSGDRPWFVSARYLGPDRNGLPETLRGKGLRIDDVPHPVRDRAEGRAPVPDDEAIQALWTRIEAHRGHMSAVEMVHLIAVARAARGDGERRAASDRLPELYARISDLVGSIDDPSARLDARMIADELRARLAASEQLDVRLQALGKAQDLAIRLVQAALGSERSVAALAEALKAIERTAPPPTSV
jgi:DNA-binding response OmpR family regulator